ncbi:hypothetical protein [Streptomyces sp. NPDC052291]|uniref:hypothetical protein n=1 Tax=Streptomyces sp. NPDC052291 TaxID=3161011 RepID=UPI00342110F3
MSLPQEDVRERFAALDRGTWITVYESWHNNDSNGGIYCSFTPRSKRESVLRNTSWDISKTDFRPGFSQHREAGKLVTTYFPSSVQGEIEPLVICREYHGIVPSTLELTEHFRLYHNLYWDELTSQFMKPNDDGTSSVAVKVTEEKIEVRTKLIRQFQAARQMDLVLYIDSVKFSNEEIRPPVNEEWTTEDFCADLHSGVITGGRPFSRFLGKRVVSPPPIEKCGIWPFEEEDTHFPDFIIGVDADGDEFRHTCNPDKLANYFGSNPGAPNYLTPVYFRREVLQKYYDNAEIYTVSDGYLHCAALWGVRIDNSAKDCVVVFLGDLGRDLPTAERDYWRSFNIARENAPSETLIRRAFFGQAAEPTASDLLFRSHYVAFKRLWRDRYGWDLFRDPEEADAGLLQRLRLPLNESQAEFESSVRIMTQLLVDAINEKQVNSRLAERVDNERGISKVARWLTLEGYPHVERDIKFLRNLQEIRSKATAHRKSSDYEKTLTKVFGPLRGSAAAHVFFADALALLTGLSEWVASHGPEHHAK